MKLKTINVGRSSIFLDRSKITAENSAEKSNVAWFKLAEFIKRGEKERALSLYRLLIHSLSDQSFLKKLEADIWFSFDPKQAEKYYNSAAHLYKKEGRHQESLMIFEQLAKQYSTTITYFEKVINLSDQLGSVQKKVLYQKKLYKLFLTIGEIEKAIVQFKEIETQIKDAESFEFHKIFVIAALTHKYAEQKVIQSSLQTALDGLLRMSADKELQQFLEEIKALNSVWYKDAAAYFEEQS